jgi:DNA-binding transcriptional MerR regulator
MGDGGLLTIGELARRTGLAVRTIRYWSDIGAMPPVGRTAAGYRLYDAESVARLDLVRTLRDLGVGLEDVRRILEKESTVAAVAAVHVEALDAQIKVLRLRRAVLRAVAVRESNPEEMSLMHQIARMSAEERRRIVDDFVTEVFQDLDTDPALRDRMRDVRPELPDDPAPEQVDAWVELSELVADPDFRHLVRRMAEHHASGRAERGGRDEPGAYLWFAKRVAWLVGQARERGVTPESSEAAGVLTELFPGTLDAERRAVILERLEAGTDPRTARYNALVRTINGEPTQPDRTADFAWLAAALRAQR